MSITVRKGKVLEDGHCQFCGDKRCVVNVVTGRDVVVRFCNACLKTVAGKCSKDRDVLNYRITGCLDYFVDMLEDGVDDVDEKFIEDARQILKELQT